MASKSQRWVVDSGILRKKGVEEEPQELLVFGYSCKLFRDDEKAKMIDQGKHLIPWMGDNELRIDRYDGRGALGDLKMYEPPPGGFDLRTFLTEDELKVEQFCDEERYMSLYNNDAEESMYHEEEMKRFHQALDSENVYGQVAYNYNDEDSKKNEDSTEASNSQEEEDQAFVPPTELEIPEDMKVPETEKLNAIITKTALFISRQGGQMEILIKAKQANNPQFSFLSIDGELYPYYRHVLEAIKSGKYNPEKEPVKEESEHDDSDEDDQPYLHPSLAPSFAKVEAAPSIPSIPNIKYKPSADCAYSMLVNKITGKPPPSKMPQPEVPVQQQPPMQNYYQQPPLQQTYAAYSLPQQYSHGPVLYNNGHLQATEASQPLENTVLTMLAETPYHNQTKEPPSLVPYGPSKPLTRPSFIVPPADVQIIIDKMASYVAKNGRDFETIVKNKGDPRFNFLELSHQYHGYYAHKLTIYEGAINPRVLTEEELLQKQELQEEKQKKLEEMQRKQQRMEEVQKRVKMIQAKKKSDVKTKPGITTVSFSIKKPKDGESNVIEKRNALPMEESDDDEDEERRDNLQPKPDSQQESKKEPEENVKDDREAESKYRPDDLELVDLTDDIFDNIQKERRERQENRRDGTSSKDKRTSSRERQLQLERKRKAAMFLSQIQSLSPLATKNVNLTSNPKRDDDEVSSVPSPTVHPDVVEIEESSSQSSSLMNRLKSADLESKRPRYRSRSRSGSHGHSDRFKSTKKHKKKKSSHRSTYYDSPSSSRSHKSKKSKKSSRHRSRSPRKHYPSSRHSQRNSSSSDSSSDSA